MADNKWCNLNIGVLILTLALAGGLAGAEAVKRDFEETLAAAQKGDAKAQNILGLCYAKGVGVPKDSLEAVRWYRKAADQGDANAQYILGLSYDKGDGVSKDSEEAVKWIRKAADQGLPNAIELLKQNESNCRNSKK